MTEDKFKLTRASDDPKVRENRVRRMAERRGLQIQKSRRRDPGAYDFGLYRIIDGWHNFIVAGASPWHYSMTLDEVEEWLESLTKDGDLIEMEQASLLREAEAEDRRVRQQMLDRAANPPPRPGVAG